jgi:hypothetical protein
MLSIVNIASVPESIYVGDSKGFKSDHINAISCKAIIKKYVEFCHLPTKKQIYSFHVGSPYYSITLDAFRSETKISVIEGTYGILSFCNDRIYQPVTKTLFSRFRKP